jgi:hypothetical protein
MQIHVLEEARHICFASRFLEERVPAMSAWRRWRLKLYAPFILWGTVAPMLRIPSDVVRTHAIPREVVREAHRSPEQRTRVLNGIRPVLDLCERTGLLTRTTERLWNWLGLSPDRFQAA